LSRIRKAFNYSMDGLVAAYHNEAAFRQEIWLAAVMIPIALMLPVSRLEKAVLIAVVLLVFVVELLNSAIESVVDRISLEHNDLSKRAKDIGSAAVLISLINVLAVWGLILSGL